MEFQALMAQLGLQETQDLKANGGRLASMESLDQTDLSGQLGPRVPRETRERQDPLDL